MTIAVDVDQLRQHGHALPAEADVVERCSSLDPVRLTAVGRSIDVGLRVLDRPVLFEGAAR